MATPNTQRGNLNPVVVIAPHLDDAVLSCGQLLAARPGSTVVTVFAGVPDDAGVCTDWDRHCGFSSAAEAMKVRRDEDNHALGLLSAKPLWLDFLDSQYGETPSAGEICLVLQQALRDLAPDEVLVPLGLFHSDHLLVHEACDAALRVPSSVPLLVYEDVPYRSIGDLLSQRLASLRTSGASALRVQPGGRGTPVLRELKAQAVAAYASQLRGMGPRGTTEAARPERYWQLDWSEKPQREGAGSRPHPSSVFLRRVGC